MSEEPVIPEEAPAPPEPVKSRSEAIRDLIDAFTNRIVNGSGVSLDHQAYVRAMAAKYDLKANIIHIIEEK